MFKLYLLVTSEFLAPDEITEVLSLSPTRTFHKGKTKPKTTMTYQTNGWCLDSHFQGELPECLHEFVLFLRAKSSEFAVLKGQCEAWLECVLDGQPNFPPVHLAPEVMGILHELGIGLEFDIYERYF